MCRSLSFVDLEGGVHLCHLGSCISTCWYLPWSHKLAHMCLVSVSEALLPRLPNRYSGNNAPCSANSIFNSVLTIFQHYSDKCQGCPRSHLIFCFLKQRLRLKDGAQNVPHTGSSPDGLSYRMHHGNEKRAFWYPSSPTVFLDHTLYIHAWVLIPLWSLIAFMKKCLNLIPSLKKN